MNTQNFDYFSLQKYSFSLNKTHNFSSILTILLSVSILIISILINLETVSHLWLNRNQLPVKLSRSVALPNPLTDTLVCFGSNDSALNGTIPQAIFIGAFRKRLDFPYVSKDWIRKNKPSLVDQIGPEVSCVNIAGHKFTQISNVIQIGIFAQNASFFIEVVNQSNLQANEGSKFKQFDVQISSKMQQSKGAFFRTINAIIKDNLRISYSAQQISTFYNQEQSIHLNLSSKIPQINCTKFGVVLQVPLLNFKDLTNWNHVKFSIIREDLGFIIGAVLSWLSILTLVSGVTVSLFMGQLVTMLQIQELFHISPKMKNPSIFKFAIASIIKGIFPKEDSYVRFSQKLQSLKDIGLMLRIKHTLRRLFPYKNKRSAYYEATDFDVDNNKRTNVQEYYSVSQPQSLEQFSPISSDLSKVEDGKPQCFLISAKRSFLKYLDTGSDEISIIYSKSIKSKSNVVVTILFLLAFILILLVFGALQTGRNVQVYNSKVFNFQYELQYNQIIFATFFEPSFLLQLIDGNYNVISTISLSNSSDCLNGFNQDQLIIINKFIPYIYCLSKGVKLVQSRDNTQVISLHINNLNLDTFYLLTFPKQPQNFHYSPFNNLLIVSPFIQYDNYNYRSSIKITNFIEQKSQVFMASQMSIIQTIQINHRKLQGLIICPDPVQTTYKANQNTFFNIIQSVWGFATIFFALTLSKIAKHINLTQKDRNSFGEKVKSRENICILLSIINRIQIGRHKEELSKVKYYLKSHLPQKN